MDCWWKSVKVLNAFDTVRFAKDSRERAPDRPILLSDHAAQFHEIVYGTEWVTKVISEDTRLRATLG